MKKVLVFVCLLLFSISGYSATKRATIDEVKTSINEIEKVIKTGNEVLVGIYSAALEIEKRATTDYLAEIIKNKICKITKISSNDFDKLREKYSFFDLAIGCAVSQVDGIQIDKLMKTKENKAWEDILSLNGNCEKVKDIITKINQLNPKK